MQKSKLTGLLSITAIITNALFLAYKVVNIKKAKKLVISAAEFVLNDLNIIFENDCICFHITI